MTQLVIDNTDNTSAKEFASVLLGLIKFYSFCNGHCTNCKLLTLKCIEEAGGLNLQVEMEGYFHPITRPSQPATLDTAILTGIPDVLLMGNTASPIVIVEGKFCKDIPCKDARDSDIGQLLFYMVGNLIKNTGVERDEQYVLGILIEGKQFLVCYGTMTLAEEHDMQIDLRVSKFCDVFDASNLAYLRELCFNISNLNK
uniref:Uncharacterized protein n=1 Tax=Amphimedon queenslandica TaxID=400682 RepID=A0A1X7VJC9_AMPQE